MTSLLETSKEWYIIHTAGIGSHGVLFVQSLLDRLGFDAMVWVPTQKTSVIRYGKPCPNNKPLFPGYVFIKTCIHDSQLEQSLMEAKIGKFLKAPGDTLPTKISEVDIAKIRTQEETGAESAPQEITSVEVGNLIEVCVGPLVGVRGIVLKVSGHDVYIETLMFGRSAPVQVNISHLSKLLDTYEETKKDA